jgi:hypothetical protein
LITRYVTVPSVLRGFRDRRDRKGVPARTFPKPTERPRGERAGEYSLRVDDQWRVCFRWERGEAYDVEITDYHQERTMPRKAHPPIHPGEIPREEFLEPIGLTQYRLAKDISVPPRRINEIV